MQTSVATAAVETEVADAQADSSSDQRVMALSPPARDAETGTAASPRYERGVKNVSTQFPLLVLTRKDGDLSRDHAGRDKNMETGRANMETGRANMQTGKEKIETAATKIATRKEKVETGKANIVSARASSTLRPRWLAASRGQKCMTE